MKKPDAFEKMIIPMLGTRDLLGKNGKYLSVEVAKLLRAHHRRVMRMVDNLYRNAPGMQSQFVSYRVACRDIRAKLKKMEGAK